VLRIELVDPVTIRFVLPPGDRELPLIIGLMPVLAKHATDAATFEQTGFAPLLGSGPYVVSNLRRGGSIAFRRDPDWWGADLPVNRGAFNFDEIRYEYYRDANSLFEAFKAGLVDLRIETDPARWRRGYDIPAVREGLVIREALPDPSPTGMTGFVFNTRRPQLSDPRLREALGYLFDFPWINATFFGGLYTRDESFFSGELASTGRPADEAEQALFAPFPGAVRDDVLAGRWLPPVLDGSGRDRAAAAVAMKLLDRAGYVRRGRVTMPDTGEPLRLDILVVSRDQERIALAYAGALGRIGIRAGIRLVDGVTYERRRQAFDFDMIIAAWSGTASPGNEQAFRWSAAAADEKGSFNFPGVRSEAADAAIATLIAARDRGELASAARALDRVLLSGFYVVPLFHAPQLWLAYRAGLKRPERIPLLGPAIELWWRSAP
jgi:peptide/nickel transport system substrate-binding protein